MQLYAENKVVNFKNGVLQVKKRGLNDLFADKPKE